MKVNIIYPDNISVQNEGDVITQFPAKWIPLEIEISSSKDGFSPYYIGSFDGTKFSRHKSDLREVVNTAIDYAKKKGLTKIYAIRESVHENNKTSLAVIGSK